MQGLCGKFNYKRDDELQGLYGITESVKEFIENFKDKSCTDKSHDAGDVHYYVSQKNLELFI